MTVVAVTFSIMMAAGGIEATSMTVHQGSGHEEERKAQGESSKTKAPPRTSGALLVVNAGPLRRAGPEVVLVVRHLKLHRAGWLLAQQRL